MIRLYSRLIFNKPMSETFYFNRLYDDPDVKFKRSMLYFDTVYGEPGCYVLIYLFIALFHVPIFLMFLALPVTSLLFPLDPVERSQTVAEVVSCLKIPTRGATEIFEISYQYTILNSEGQPVTFLEQDQITAANISCEQPPTTIVISYIVTDPELSFIVVERNTSQSSELAGIALLGLATLYTGFCSYFGTSRIWHFFRSNQKWRRLQSEGIVCGGYVLNCRIVGRGKSGTPEWIRITYSFTAPDGTQIKGKQVKMMDNPAKPSADTPVAILYAGKRCHVVL